MKVTWILPDGGEISADVDNGVNMMAAAVDNNVPGITGECGGNLSCATCHVYVSDNWTEKTGAPEDFEDAMLDVAEAQRKASSRLSCQILADSALDGLVLVVPAV